MRYLDLIQYTKLLKLWKKSVKNSNIAYHFFFKKEDILLCLLMTHMGQDYLILFFVLFFKFQTCFFFFPNIMQAKLFLKQINDRRLVIFSSKSFTLNHHQPATHLIISDLKKENLSPCCMCTNVVWHWQAKNIHKTSVYNRN